MANGTVQPSTYALVKRWEGLQLTSYQVGGTGAYTIGYGRAYGVQPGQVITQATANSYLQTDVQNAANCVNQSVTRNLTQGQFDALVDFVYNLGCGYFNGSSLLEAVNSGDDGKAASLFPEYSCYNGQRVAGLVNRRLNEQQLYQG